MTEHELSHEMAAMVARLRVLNEQRTKLDEESEFIKQHLRQALATGSYTYQGTAMVQMRPTRRFNPELARTVLDPEQLALCTVETVDRATAQKLLPPADYESCMKETGRATVNLL